MAPAGSYAKPCPVSTGARGPRLRSRHPAASRGASHGVDRSGLPTTTGALKLSSPSGHDRLTTCRAWGRGIAPRTSRVRVARAPFTGTTFRQAGFSISFVRRIARRRTPARLVERASGCNSLGRCPTASPAAHPLRPAEHQPTPPPASRACRAVGDWPHPHPCRRGNLGVFADGMGHCREC